MQETWNSDHLFEFEVKCGGIRKHYLNSNATLFLWVISYRALGKMFQIWEIWSIFFCDTNQWNVNYLKLNALYRLFHMEDYVHKLYLEFCSFLSPTSNIANFYLFFEFVSKKSYNMIVNIMRSWYLLVTAVLVFTFDLSVQIGNLQRNDSEHSTDSINLFIWFMWLLYSTVFCRT